MRVPEFFGVGWGATSFFTGSKGGPDFFHEVKVRGDQISFFAFGTILSIYLKGWVAWH